ncbi:MAG: TVP38/TMEM64 family protein, partial [Bradymonadaceae bacterium]
MSNLSVTTEIPPPPEASVCKRLPRLLLLGLLVGTFLLLATGPTEAWLTSLFAAVGNWGAAGVVVFVVVFVAATIVLVPGSVLTIAAGFLFGVVGGLVVVSLASLLGALAALVIGRYLARDLVRDRLARSPRIQLLLQVIEDDGFKAVLLARLVPFLPYNLLNYALGLTHVRWRPYMLGTVVGMLPGSLALVYVGAATGDLTRALAGPGSIEGAGWQLYTVGTVIVVL